MDEEPQQPESEVEQPQVPPEVEALIAALRTPKEPPLLGANF